MNSPIAYFDNAATTFPKPQCVIQDTEECLKSYCGNAGRGSHRLAMKTAEMIYDARETVGKLVSASPENVIFTLNTTYALNLAIKGIMKDGGHMLISNMEHNSVLRPTVKLANDGKLRYSVFETVSHGTALPTDKIISNIKEKLCSDTKMIVCIHASNICSFISPISEIGRFCRQHGLKFTVDAAQSAGHVPIDMISDGIDILCMPGHKGLYAPQGVGIAVLRDGTMLETLVEGGNGINSLDTDMGTLSPERYESGTLCAPAIIGLASGVRFITDIGINAIAAHTHSLWERAYSRLSEMRGVTVYDSSDRGSILLFNLRGLPSDAVGEVLAKQGFCLRTGYHCAPLAHKTLMTPDGGAVRISFGIFNRSDEADLLCDAIYRIAKNGI